MSRTPVAGSAPVGPYTPGIVAEGRVVYVSGQGPLTDGVYQEGSIEDETELTLANIGRILAAAGSGFDQVLRCRVFLADIADFDAMNAVYERVFPQPRPARTTIQAGALPGGIKVEIDCDALVP